MIDPIQQVQVTLIVDIDRRRISMKSDKTPSVHFQFHSKRIIQEPVFKSRCLSQIELLGDAHPSQVNSPTPRTVLPKYLITFLLCFPGNNQSQGILSTICLDFKHWS